MYKILTLVIMANLCMITTAFSGEFKKEFAYPEYDQAKGAANRVYFDLQSTKILVITTTVRGYALKFTVTAMVEDNLAKNAKITFKINDLNTDNGMRDDKMHQVTLDTTISEEMYIALDDAIRLDIESLQILQGNLFIRNRLKPITIKLTAISKGDLLIIEGESMMSIEALELPSPSIAIAKVNDQILAGFKLVINIQEIYSFDINNE